MQSNGESKKQAAPRATLRNRIHERLNCLTERRLRVVDDFLAYLEDRESNEATEELLRIPGFLEELARAEKEVVQGKLTDVKNLRRKY